MTSQMSKGRRIEMGDLSLADLNSNLFLDSVPPRVDVFNAAGRLLIRLERRDGRITATYDPADLDEAAKMFVQVILEHGSMLADFGAKDA